ncbi:hypothetical protein MY8738_009853 [Beauveria namnaoensis]
MLDPLYARVMCGIVRDQGPESRRNDVCARRSLENVLSEAFQRFQLEFRIGFEVEFKIWRPNANDKLVLHSTGLGGSACSGLRHAWYDYVEEAMLILLEAGVGLEGMHTEGQQGQFEFNLGPKPPMEAVDELVFVHDTLKRVFAHHGLVATMLPRPAAHRTQSIGPHVHLSITDRPELEQSFLAGILRHLPSLVAFSLPYDLSYERLRPGQGGSDIVAWGTQDRRVPDTSSLSEEQITDSGAPCIPSTFEAALDQLERDYESEGGVRETLMESQVISHYLKMKRFERFQLAQMGEDGGRSLLTEVF